VGRGARGPRGGAAAVSVDVSAAGAFAPRAAYAAATLLGACAGEPRDLVYGSDALPASEAAWAYFAAGSDAPPRLGDGGLLDFGDGVADVLASAFWHLSRWEEGPGSVRDERGRFPGSAALADPAKPAVDALLQRFREAVGARAPRGFTVALTHDVDVPWRWSGRRALRGAAARARAAARSRRRSDLGAELAGLLAAPARRLAGTDPNWAYERIAAAERARGARSTYFVMAGGHHPADGPAPGTYDRLRPAVVTQIAAQGDEVGLHPSYTAAETPGRIGEERDRLEALAGTSVAGVRFHYLRHETHRDLPQLDRLGFTYDSSQGFADALGLRAGLSFPYHPYDLETDAPLGIVELPLAVMDATLAEPRYLGLGAIAGLDAAVALLERVAATGGTVAVLWHTDRFSREYARGWDRAYERLLDWVADRGGRLCSAADAVRAGSQAAAMRG
jgi:hypothetical protein